MEEVLLVAVVQSVEQLPHDAGIVLLVKVHHAGLEQSHQIVIHVLEHQIERALVLAELERVLLVGDDFTQVDNVLVVQLTEDFDFAYSRNREPFLLMLQANLLQGHQFIGFLISSFVHLMGSKISIKHATVARKSIVAITNHYLSVRSLADLFDHIEHIDAPFAPVLPAGRRHGPEHIT